MATPSQGAGMVVIGYFATGHAAHRAINALIDQGFEPSQIGAAFHVSEEPSLSETGAAQGAPSAERPELGGTLREEFGTTNAAPTLQPTASYGGPLSGSSGVQPNITGPGSGPHFSAPGRMPPIPGAGLTHTGLPSELPSELPSDGSVPSEADLHKGSWSNRLQNVFPGRTGAHEHTATKAAVTKESQNFGTGEGRLQLNTAPLRPYSQPSMERSFSEAGAEGGHARSLSHRLGGGGAVVSVHTADRAAEAQRILESHDGEVRPGDTDAYLAQSGGGQVEVFGTFDRDDY